ISREEALERFADNPFKREIIETAEADEGALGDRFSLYRNDGWADLCLGPHVPSTDRLGAFKLLSLAGAYWRGDETRGQLQRVCAPSGHLEKYRANMYPAMHEGEGGEYFVKPMNCPLHVLIYRSQTRSYRDLPMRLSELGTVYRYERPGTLHGLFRIRGLTID